MTTLITRLALTQNESNGFIAQFSMGRKPDTPELVDSSFDMDAFHSMSALSIDDYMDNTLPELLDNVSRADVNEPTFHSMANDVVLIDTYNDGAGASIVVIRSKDASPFKCAIAFKGAWHVLLGWCHRSGIDINTQLLLVFPSDAVSVFDDPEDYTDGDKWSDNDTVDYSHLKVDKSDKVIDDIIDTSIGLDIALDL